MNDWAVAFTVFIAIVMFIFGIIIGSISGYKEGQIDYANGEVKYELVEQKNEERIWEKIDK